MTSDRRVLALTDIESIDDPTADALARAGYRTVWRVHRTSEADLASDVEGLTRASAGRLKAGIGDLDPETYRYRPHYAPDESVPETLPVVDPAGDDGPATADSGAVEDRPLDNENTRAGTESDPFVVEWEANTDGTGVGPDALTRLPSPLGSSLAIIATILTSGLLASSIGLSTALGAGLLSALLFAVTFRALTSDRVRYVVPGNVLLIVSSLVFLGALGLSMQATSSSRSILVSTALIFGVVAVVVDLTVGLGGPARRQVTASILVISIALPVGVVLTLPLESPLFTELVRELTAAFTTFLEAPSSGLTPFGLLVLEGGLLVIGQYVLRARVPQAAVPPLVRPLFGREDASLGGALGRGRLLVVVLCWAPVALSATIFGGLVRSPTGVTGYGPTVFGLTERALAIAWTAGRTLRLHWLVLFGLACLLGLSLAGVVRNRVVLSPRRRSLVLSTFGYVALTAAVVSATPVVTDTVEPLLAALATQQETFAPMYALYQGLGPTPVFLLGSYLGVVVIAFLLYGVSLLEGISAVPDGTSGLALGCGFLSGGAILVGLADAPALVVFGGVAGAVYVWDVGQYATELGARFGRATETKRAELIHACGALAAAGGATALTYGGYRLTKGYTIVGSDIQLVLGLVLSLAGAIALLFSLRA